ncbi:MAG: sulfotransferase [Planctomycetota bacterium]|nr:sulfotransferase [Planctomycetota bacterium]MDA1180630.1 sulfotransferase [Planctomycetota bacterium]
MIQKERRSHRPILVFGMNRCGTKWLSNLLANHADISAVQAEEYQGIVECDILSEVPRKFDFDSDDDYAAFLALWNMSDFVRISQVDVTSFARLPKESRTPATLLKLTMDRFAEINGTSHWLQKFGPDSLDSALRDFPDAAVLFIVRNALDVIHSTHALSKREGRNESYMSIAFGFVLAEKQLRRALRRSGGHLTTYESLQRDVEREITKICEFLRIPFSRDLLQARFEKNSSFAKQKRQPTLPWTTRAAVGILVGMLRMTPSLILRTYAGLRPYARRTASFVPDSFRTLRHSLQQDATENTPAISEHSVRAVGT